MRKTLVGISLLVFLAGIVAAIDTSRRHFDRPAPLAPEVSAEVLPQRLVIDVADLLGQLEDLRPDEQPQQLADWAVYGTLMRSGLSSDDLRQATFDMLPLRLTAFEDVVDFDYGRGRRVFLPDGSVWLFYSETDDQRTATLSRLADQVRMERGSVPPSFTVFHYRSSLVEGRIYVEREADIPREQLFSPAYGYVEAQVATAAELGEWLNRADDLTHVALGGDGRLTLGGRRIPGARTAGVDLEGVATLYQSHRRRATAYAEVDAVIEQASKPISDAFENVVRTYNANVDVYNRNRNAVLDAARFQQAVAALARQLSRQVLTDDFSELRVQKRAIETLRPEAEERVKEAQEARWQALQQSGGMPPSEPGFSLDPQWDVPGLVADLTRLLDAPATLIADAEQILAAARAEPDDESARPRRVSTAMSVDNQFAPSDQSTYRVPNRWRPRIEAILKSIRGKSGRDVEARAIVPFLELKRDLKDARDRDAQRLHALLQHIESARRTQCARYDGGISGTRVGMNLFYTDLLAKLWASVDYYREAPIDSVEGFRSDPVDGPNLEPIYWAETWEFPSTRLWFGPKGEAYKGEPDGSSGGLNFAHVSTRVYSAGSNPLEPGKEVTPNEESRRVFGWWDRHYSEVADYEQAYHLQNQIMKWSVVTGWMVKHGSIPDLNDVEVVRSYRFDRWYAGARELKFRYPVPFLPQDHWLGGTECIEILRSYLFPSAGFPWTYIEGGVSLGSERSLNAASSIKSDIPLNLRRGALDYLQSKSGGLANLRGTIFELPRPEANGAHVLAELPQGARLRTGPTEISATSLTTDIAREADGARIAVGTDGGSVGMLHGESVPEGMRLDWRPGSIDADRVVLDRIANRAALKLPATTGLGADPHLLNGGYVVEVDGGGAEVVRLAAGGSGGGSSPPPGILGVGIPADEPGSGPYLRTTDKAVGWVFDARRGVDAQGQRVAASGVKLDAAAAAERVNAKVWQRLRRRPGAPDSANSVERIFTDRGPGESARPVVVRTRDPALGELHGFIDHDELVLERPSNAGLHQLFDDFVVNEGVTGRYLDEAFSTAQAGGTQVLEPAQSAASLHGIRAAARSSEGNYAAALTELRDAMEQGQLGDAMRSYQQNTRSRLLQGLRDGDISPAAAQFAQGGLFEGVADAKLILAVDALRGRRTEDAAGFIQEALNGDGASRDVLGAANASLRRQGSPAAADYIYTQQGAFGMSPEVARHIRLEAVGSRLHTAMATDVMPLPRRLSRASQAAFADVIRHNPPRDVYVEDTLLLNRQDWDGRPGPTLSRIAKGSDIRIEVAEAAALGDFRPSLLEMDGGGGSAGGERFVRHALEEPSSRSDKPSENRSYWFGHIVMVRSCDRDHDGTVSDDERKDCAA